MRSGALRAPASRMLAEKLSMMSCIGAVIPGGGGVQKSRGALPRTLRQVRHSKPRKVRKLLLSGVHVRATEFRTPVQRRHRFARIQEAVLVESPLHAVEALELG